MVYGLMESKDFPRSSCYANNSLIFAPNWCGFSEASVNLADDCNRHTRMALSNAVPSVCLEELPQNQAPEVGVGTVMGTPMMEQAERILCRWTHFTWLHIPHVASWLQ